MPAFFVDYNLMPFHLSLFAVILLGVVETLGYLFKIRPTKFLKQISPFYFRNLDLLNVKFSKIFLIFVENLQK